MKFPKILMNEWWPQAMTDFQRKDTSYENEVTAMVKAALAVARVQDL